MPSVERIEAIVVSSVDPLPVRRQQINVDRHLVAILDDGGRLSDVGFGGITTSTMLVGGFTLLFGETAGVSGSEAGTHASIDTTFRSAQG